MNPLPIDIVCRAIDGVLDRSSDARVLAISTDTRGLAHGTLFIALKGDKFDGHDYLSEAARAGACAAVVERDVADSPAELPLIRVGETREALRRLGSFLRKELRGKIIAIGGSNGKTSTKYMVDAVLGSALRVGISKSFNNDIGVPLTIADAKPDDDYLVLEVGTNHPGEMRPLSLMGEPHIAAITNVSAEHLEGLGDLAGVIREEAEIIAGLNPRGLLVVNGDQVELLNATRRFAGERLTFGMDSHNDLIATDIQCDMAGVRFTINNARQEFFVPMLGRHSAINAVIAIAIGRQFNLSDESIAAGLASAAGPEMRLQLCRMGSISILNDAYNANPASMVAALQTLSALETAGRRVAILGEMRELGSASPGLHKGVGQAAARHHVELLVTVGAEAIHIVDGAKNAGLAAQGIIHFGTASEAGAAIVEMLRPDDLVLLKGSRGVQLESIARIIEKAFTS